MSKRTRNLILLSLALMGVIACLFLFLHEPSYQGRVLTFWLNQCHESYYGNHLKSFSSSTTPAKNPNQSWEMRRQSEQAIRTIGTNALPILLKLTHAKDSSLKLKFFKMISRQHFVSFNPPTADYYHNLSMRGFQTLRGEAKAAVPSLIEMLNETEADVRATAAWNLGVIGPDSRAAIPLLIKNLNNPNDRVRFYSFQALASIHEEPEVVMPILIDALRKTQTDSTMYDVALSGLGNFGPQASNAIPLILPFLTNRVTYLSSQASNTLKQIDPGTAAQAGVK